MEEQKNSSVGLLSKVRLAAVGAVVLVVSYVFARYFTPLLGGKPMWVVSLVFLVFFLEFLAMPLVAYRRTASVKTALTVVVLQLFFTPILFAASLFVIWQIYA